MCYICVGFNFHLILHRNTSPPPRQVFRSGQPSTEVGVGAYFFDFSHFLENYLQIRKSRYIFALEIGSQTIGKEI